LKYQYLISNFYSIVLTGHLRHGLQYRRSLFSCFYCVTGNSAASNKWWADLRDTGQPLPFTTDVGLLGQF